MTLPHLHRYLRVEGGKTVCADGNATDNWDTPPTPDGWGFYANDFGQPVKCPADGFAPGAARTRLSPSNRRVRRSWLHEEEELGPRE
eukprot:CAMPEP_0184296034 /NCGR_PEP_ID=MMETSP1049-20130417/6999_1 /TAXON_ID=77928 /ORGANISM="Proteomonas sulcata, Strain CCMP704" /LENGTH=86 /DNA_ID=CAMNT_0026605007 /DNA_START=1001 /DNA_END=1262 /DNA_ORIENTATION=+